MGFLDRWAQKRVDRIIQHEAEERLKRLEIDKLNKDHKSAIGEVINTEIAKLAEGYDKQPEHIKVGDRAIMNYFSIKYPGRNGWDGGVHSLLTHIPQEERTAPVVVNITKMYVDTSWAQELLDKFFENHHDAWLRDMVPVDKAWNIYLNWLDRRRKNIGDYTGNKSENISKRELVGLYKTAHFEYEGSFKPRWGLNIFSFHPEGTPEFDKTFELWSREIEINLKRDELNAKMKELNEEMKKIDEEYRGIKVVSSY